jgi:hypothetical protein
MQKLYLCRGLSLLHRAILAAHTQCSLPGYWTLRDASDNKLCDPLPKFAIEALTLGYFLLFATHLQG